MTLLIIFLDSLFGGTNTPLVKFTVSQLSPTLVAFIRFSLAGLLILPIVLKENILTQDFFKKNLVLVNLLFAANILIFVNAITHTSIIMAQLLYLLTAPLVAVIGYFFLREKLTPKQILGLIVALLGLSILLVGSAKTKDILSFGTPLGNGLVFLGVIVWTLYIIFSRLISRLYSPLKLTFHNFATTALISLIFLPFDPQNYKLSFGILSVNLLLALIALAVFSTVLFFLLYQWIIKRTSAFISSLVNYMATLVAGLAGILLFGERLSSNFILGAVLLLIGVFLASGYRNGSLFKN